MVALFILFTFAVQDLMPAGNLPGRDYLVRHYTVTDGLPVNTVNGIVQDETGYLYFSTLDGLVRYDGYEFVTFNSSNSDGLQSDRIAGIRKGDSGRLWMVSETGALIAFDGSAFNTFSASEGISDPVIRVREGSRRTLWVSTLSGVSYREEGAQRFTGIEHPLFSTETWVLEPTGEGGIVVVNENGLVKWEEGEANLLLTRADSPLPPEDVVTVKNYGDEAYWVMGTGGFFLLEDGRINRNLSHIDTDSDLKVWDVGSMDENRFIFTTNLGFYEVNTVENSVSKLPVEMNHGLNLTNFALRGINGEQILLGDDEVVIDGEIVFRTEEIQSGYVDREGSIWVASATDGLFQLRRSSVYNITSDGQTPIDNIYPIIQDHTGDVWAGSLRGGLFRIDGEGISNWNSDNSGLAVNQVRFLYEDRDETLYAGLWGEGLWRFDGDEWNRERAFDEVHRGEDVTVEAMHRDRSGWLLIGSRSETVIREEGTYRVFSDRTGNGVNGVRVIREDDNGTLYLGTNGNGLALLSGETIRGRFTVEDGLSSNFIRDLHLQSEDTLWVATENRGLNRLVLDRQGALRSVAHITTEDGLIDNSLHRIIEEPAGHVWISSNAGIMRISLQELNSYADGRRNHLPVTGFDERDGMINREANGGVQTAGMLGSDNLLWFPNQRGITVFDPAGLDLYGSLPAANVLIEAVAFTDSLIRPAGHAAVTLPRGERNLRFTFTAPNFAWPEKMTFMYRMDGIQDDWQVGSRSREAVFTNLPPGNHTFEVALERKDGTVTDASLSVTIPSFFHETTGFALMLLAGLTLMIYGGYSYRMRAVRLREKVLQQRVDEQTEELKKAADEKSRIFSGITHDLKTPLSLILGPLEDIVEKSEPGWPDRVRNHLNIMQRNGNRLKQLVDQMLEVTRLRANSLQLTLRPVKIRVLTLQIAGQFHSLMKERSIRFNVTGDEIADPIYVDPEAWERIMINLMSNAIRYSPDGGEILLTFSDLGDRINFSLRDFGKGISEEEQKRVFDYLYQADGENGGGGTGIGLYLVRGLIRRMAGTIVVNSEEGKGADFVITLKKGHTHFNSKDHLVHEPSPADDPAAIYPTGSSGEFQPNHTHTQRGRKTLRKSPESGADSVYPADRGTTAGPVDTDPLSEGILLVEDDADFGRYLQSMLSEKYRVTLASEGREALEMADTSTPDLIISDVMMPGMDGFEFVNKLRTVKKYQFLPVIFLSAKDQDMDVEAGLSTGADIYLTKPIRSSMLLSQVEAVLRRERILKERRPGDANGDDRDLESRIRETMYRQLANPNLNVEVLADTLFISRSKLYRDWGEISDQTLNEYLTVMRLKEARELLLEKNFTVRQAARAVGYTDPNYFSTRFKKAYGTPPSRLKTIDPVNDPSP